MNNRFIKILHSEGETWVDREKIVKISATVDMATESRAMNIEVVMEVGSERPYHSHLIFAPIPQDGMSVKEIHDMIYSQIDDVIAGKSNVVGCLPEVPDDEGDK